MSNKLKIARRTTGSIPRTDKNGVKYNQYYYLILPSSNKLAVEQFKADMAENGIKLIYDEDGKFGTNTGCLLYSTRNIIPTGAELERVQLKDGSTRWLADISLWKTIADSNKQLGFADEMDLREKAKRENAVISELNALMRKATASLQEEEEVVEDVEESDDDENIFGE